MLQVQGIRHNSLLVCDLWIHQWRLAVHSRNVAIYILSDYIVRQTIILYYYHFTTMNKSNIFHDINLRYGCTALRLIHRHEHYSSKPSGYTNCLTFLTRCIKNRIVLKNLQVRPPVPTKGACRDADWSSSTLVHTQGQRGDSHETSP